MPAISIEFGFKKTVCLYLCPPLTLRLSSLRVVEGQQQPHASTAERQRKEEQQYFKYFISLYSYNFRQPLSWIWTRGWCHSIWTSFSLPLNQHSSEWHIKTKTQREVKAFHQIQLTAKNTDTACKLKQKQCGANVCSASNNAEWVCGCSVWCSEPRTSAEVAIMLMIFSQSEEIIKSLAMATTAWRDKWYSIVLFKRHVLLFDLFHNQWCSKGSKHKLNAMHQSSYSQGAFNNFLWLLLPNLDIKHYVYFYMWSQWGNPEKEKNRP